MRFRVFNDKGVPIAQYENESELHSFIKASYPWIDVDVMDHDAGLHPIMSEDKKTKVAELQVMPAPQTPG